MNKFILFTFSPRKLFLWIGILIFVGLIGYYGLYFWARLNLQGVFFFNWGREASTEPVSLTAGSTTFRVPKNYLYQRDIMRGGKVRGFSVEVLLPDMTPYNDSLKYEFDECRGFCRRLNISIHEPAMEGEWLDYALSSMLKHVKVSGNGTGSRSGDGIELGLTHYKELGSKIDQTEGYARFTSDGRTDFYYTCLKEGSGPSPFCTGHMEYAGLTIEYDHHRRYLADWQEIQQKIQQLLESFDQLKNQGEK